MKLLIDNLDGRGAQDYSAFVDMGQSCSVVRRLNQPAELNVVVTLTAAKSTIPVSGARVALVRNDGSYLFSGYLTADASSQYLGQAADGPQYGYSLHALSDVMLLDQKAVSLEPAFVARGAGGAISQLTTDVMPGRFDLTGVQAGDAIPFFGIDPSRKWSALAGEIALAGRCSYRDADGKLFFAPLAATTYPLVEADPAFSPDALQLLRVNRLVNDLTVVGELEPAAHVKDYFVGDGYSTTFYMSQIPFTRSNEIPSYSRTILNEEYTELDPTHWVVLDPQGALSVNNGQLVVAGGTERDGETCLTFVEMMELGGATVLVHGDVTLSGASSGIIGGLYNGAVGTANCIAGFRATPSGNNSSIQALVNGVAVGTALVTQSGHHYVLTTYLYPTESYRMGQLYHSSVHPSGNARGGDAIAADVRIVLQVQDIDPSNPGSHAAPALVLYDGVMSDAPGFCIYALINAASMQCSLAFTYLSLATDALVRTTVEDGSPATAQVGSLISGAECRVSGTPALTFYPEYIPAANEATEVSYRGQGRAMARVINSASILAHQNGADDGIRGEVKRVAVPPARTSVDCETAALALLDDAGQGWSGEYQVWNNLLPGGAPDILAGDGLAVNLPTWNASFLAIVREADLVVLEFEGETIRYTLKFTDAGDPSLGFAFETAAITTAGALTPIDVTQIGMTYLPDLSNAGVTTITSTTITVDAGTNPPAGGGIEVRYSDMAWGMGNSRNLVGRFTSRTFTLPRYARGQSYFLRSYDSSAPAKYSRYSTALFVDYPL